MKRNDIVELLRKAAGELEVATDSTIMPGWDADGSDSIRATGIRESARAIAADELTCNEGTKVQVSKLGMLVRYIAEMLEE